MSRANVVFFGCNYNDKKIKAQFDSLKKRIENDTALSCVVVDKRAGKSARDLWKDIQAYVEDSAACVFDVTGFRPNVVLELGYALSIKAEGQVYITFRKRRAKGKSPLWQLSDIGHLNRHEYVNVPELESFVREQLELTPFQQQYGEFVEECQKTNAPEKYEQNGLKVLQELRARGALSEAQIQARIAGSNCRIAKMLTLLRRPKLIKRKPGQNGKYYIPELPV